MEELRFAQRLERFDACLADSVDDADARSSCYEREGRPRGAAFDVALMLKLVPVLHRQERDSLAVLRDVPARTLVLSGAKESMTKRRDISRRERGILRGFVEGIEGEVAAEFETADEVVVVVVRKPT